MRIKCLLFVGLLSWFVPTAFSQTQTTPNLVTNTWNGVVTVPDLSQFGCCSGGPQPAYTTNDGTLHFSYGGYTAWQIYAINQALSGTGVQIKGYNYSYNVLNTGESSGNLQSWVWLTSPTGMLHEYYWYDLSADTQGTWKNYSGTQNFTQNYSLANVGTLGIQFYGSDNRYWAGYYGPKVKDISLTLNYGVDQCTINPLSSPSCPGYTTAYVTNNITSTTSTSSPVSVTSSVVQNTITPTTTTAVSTANPAAPVQLVPQQTTTTLSVTPMQETKKDDNTKTSVSEGQTTSSSPSERKPVEGKTARQELQERRVAAARRDAVAKGQQAVKESGDAKSMDQQIASQSAIVAAIGFNPGFDAYQAVSLKDSAFYKPYEVYGNQKVIDNRTLGRGLFGATDRLHNDMIDQQYNNK